MELTYSNMKGTDIPFMKVGLLRAEDGKLAFLWILGKNGALKQAVCLTDFGSNAIVKLELGDTMFMLRASFITRPVAISYYVEGQNVRVMRNGKVIGPEIAEWVPREMIPAHIQEAIERHCLGQSVPGKYFVAPDPRWSKQQGENSKIVYSTDDNEKINKTAPATRDGMFGKKRRHV